MTSLKNNPQLVVIVGQTASGKSALALDLASRFGGEIIAADSRTVYRGMDIGTAKPTESEVSKVRHHLINVVDPATSFTVADFKELANKAILDVAARGKLPILVGGTGLYVDAVLYDFSFREPADPKLRKMLEGLSAEELQNRLTEQGLALPSNQLNPRHLIRTLETKGQTGGRKRFRSNTLILGLQVEPDVLRQRVADRVEGMVADGLVYELKHLSEMYGWSNPALQTPAYKAFRPYLEGTISLDEAKQQFTQNDLQYAKRQKTWFKRNKVIQWISKTEDAVDLVATFLNK